MLLILKLLPLNLISYLVGWLAYLKFPAPIPDRLIRIFIRLYKIDCSDSEKEPTDYLSLGEFFCRGLKPGARPVGAGIVSPVDGTLRDFGKIVDSRIPEVKGRNYFLDDLLAKDHLTDKFRSGFYFNFYLSPPDYHRIHAPVSGEVRKLIYIPGKLFPVNDFALNRIPGLFCQNERLITFLESDAYGLVAVVKVGAFNVGRIRLAFDPLTTNQSPLGAGAKSVTKICQGGIKLAKGQELGTFELGSSVVLLFERGDIKVSGQESLTPKRVRVGQSL